MNGMISKSCCPMYNNGISSKNNYGTSCKNNFGTSCKIDLIPRRLSNLHLQRISAPVATKRILKHRVYSSHGGKDLTGLRFEVPVVSRSVLPYVLLGVGSVGMASGVLKSNACYGIFLGVVAVFIAREFLGNIMHGFAVLHDNTFSIGDEIQVGHVKGEVTETGPKTTSLLTAENHRIVLPTSWLFGLDLVNVSRAPWHAIALKIYVEIDEIEKIPEISKEIINMMRSDSNIYLEDEQPYCYLSEVGATCVEVCFGCKLKSVCEDELSLAEQEFLIQSAQIIQKHGATLGDPIKKSL